MDFVGSDVKLNNSYLLISYNTQIPCLCCCHKCYCHAYVCWTDDENAKNNCKCCPNPIDYIQMLISIKFDDTYKIGEPENTIYSVMVYKGKCYAKEHENLITDLTKTPYISFDINETIDDFNDTYADILNELFNNKNISKKYYYLVKNIHKKHINYVEKIISKLRNSKKIYSTKNEKFYKKSPKFRK